MYLLDVITKLDNMRCLEHPLLVDNKLTMLQRVNVTLDQKEIRAALDGQEAASRNVDTMAILEVLDGGTGGSLELGRIGASEEFGLPEGTGYRVPG